MDLPEGVGPHEGRELELMLKGEKMCAIFGDAIPDNGIIPEEIIPEDAFRPYITDGSVIRLTQELQHPVSNHRIRHVCFTLPGHEWRGHALLWLRKQHDLETDSIIGRLLGYSDIEIAAFIAHRNRHTAAA